MLSSELTCSVVVLASLPSSPVSAKWTSAEDVSALSQRTGTDHHHHAKDRKWKHDQFIEAITDPVTWLLFALLVLQCVVTGGLGTFSSLLIHRGFGFDVFSSQLLGLPLSGFAISLYFLVA